MSDSLQPRGLQHSRLPCPPPGACSNSCPSSQGCHPTISLSVLSFSSCLQSFPASGSFPMSQFFAPGGQSIGASALPEALPLAQLLHCMLIVSQWFSCCFLHRTCNFRYYICVQIGKWSRSVVSDSATPWTVAYQAPPMGFSRQEYWNGLPFPFPEDLPHPGIKPGSPAL